MTNACAHACAAASEPALQMEALEAWLNDFAPAIRAGALQELSARALRDGARLEPPAATANMHCHTFFSFNAYGYSPTALAWLAQRRGYGAMGIVDFDTLDGVSEFLDACDALGVRGSAGMETRAHLPEYATLEINSPGEPGVLYYMGVGFPTRAAPAAAASALADLRRRAEARNRAVVARVNAYLDPVTVDYARDVLPMTPAGYATERHIVRAYLDAAARLLPAPAAFWAERLGVAPAEIPAAGAPEPALQNLARARLMKAGGVGYIPPTPELFPTVDEVNHLTEACGALPCYPWLDGVSEGEQRIGALLEFLVAKGVAAINIIPDRNWNIRDAETRRRKVSNLHAIVQLAGELDLPVIIGTEMNSFGQKLVDDFDAPELAPVRQAFLDGATFIYGHTRLLRAAGLGYQSAWARAHLPGRRQRNAFFTQAGRLARPGAAGLSDLKTLSPAMSPHNILMVLGK